MLNVVHLATTNPYIPWDVNLFYKGMTNVRGSVGAIVNIGFWIFLIVFGVYLISKIIRSVAK